MYPQHKASRGCVARQMLDATATSPRWLREPCTQRRWMSLVAKWPQSLMLDRLRAWPGRLWRVAVRMQRGLGYSSYSYLQNGANGARALEVIMLKRACAPSSRSPISSGASSGNPCRHQCRAQRLNLAQISTHHGLRPVGLYLAKAYKRSALIVDQDFANQSMQGPMCIHNVRVQAFYRVCPVQQQVSVHAFPNIDER